MEKNIILNKILDKELFTIESCSKADDNSCSLILSGQDGELIRKYAPIANIKKLLKKNGWFKEKLYGVKYRSSYTADIIPYYNSRWKKFIWREYIDDYLFMQNDDFPDELILFLEKFDNIRLLFKKELDNYFSSLPKEGTLSSLLDVYWAEFLWLHPDEVDVLHKLHLLFLSISKDQKEIDFVDRPLSIEKYLWMTQDIDNIDFDYTELVRAYIDRLYNYLLFCYQEDKRILSDIYGKDIVNANVSIMEYSDYLLLFDAVRAIITYLK